MVELQRMGVAGVSLRSISVTGGAFLGCRLKRRTLNATHARAGLYGAFKVQRRFRVIVF
jgi:hypothetical protein